MHYHDDPNPDLFEEKGHYWAQKSFVENLQKWEYKPKGSSTAVPVRKMGITHAALTNATIKMIPYYGKLKSPKLAAAAGAGAGVAPAVALPAMPAGARGPGAPGVGGFDRGLGGNLGAGAAPPGGVPGVPPGTPTIPQTEFTVEFLWQETPESDRKPIDPTAPPPVEGQTSPDAPPPTGQATQTAPVTTATSSAPIVPAVPANSK